MNTLIITDNTTQYERVRDYLNNLKEKANTTIVFKHSGKTSPLYTHKDFANNPEASINVKEQVEELINKFNLVISLHCKQIFPRKLVKNLKCINVHPGYNPINRGWFPQVFAIAFDLPIGVTIHEMDEEVDNGKIIARELVPKYQWDTSESLYNRILDKEIELFEKTFPKIVSNTYSSFVPESRGNFFKISDFKQLLEFDLNETNTFETFYNRLRALTHGHYRNAYFVDKATGKKIFIKIEIEKE